MVKAGLPILNVLGMLRDQIEHPTMKEIIEDVKKSWGVSLYPSVLKNTQKYLIMFIDLIKAGKPEQMFLLKLVDLLRNEKSQKEN